MSILEYNVFEELSDAILAATNGETLRPIPARDDSVRDNFIAANSSYSGTDAAVLALVNENLLLLGNVETFSYSVLREKGPVRVLGRSYAKGYTSGPRTIAGSLVFVVFDRHPLFEIVRQLNIEPKTDGDRWSSPVADQIPPIDLILWFSNEYGRKSILRLYGVEFLQEGQVHSINDLYSENTTQYVARDIDVLMGYKDVQSFRNLLYERQVSGQFTDSHLAYLLEYKRKIEKRIADTDTLILRLQQERGKRALVTFGMTELFGNKNLNTEYEKQLRIKESLIKELRSINNAVLDHQQNIYGWKPEDKLEGTAKFDGATADNLTLTRT